MTLTIHLPQEQETRLLQQARRRGRDATEYVLRLIEQDLAPPAASKQRKISARGKYAGSTRTVDDFLREKHEETEREERRWEERHRNLRA
jgi:hypothetical protein